LIQPRLCYRRI